ASIAALSSLVPAASAAQTSLAAPLRARTVSAAHDDTRIRFMGFPPRSSAAAAPLCTPARLEGQRADFLYYLFEPVERTRTTMALPRGIKAGHRSSCLRVHYRFVTSWRSPRDLRLSALSALGEPHSPPRSHYRFDHFLCDGPLRAARSGTRLIEPTNTGNR